MTIIYFYYIYLHYSGSSPTSPTVVRVNTEETMEQRQWGLLQYLPHYLESGMQFSFPRPKSFPFLSGQGSCSCCLSLFAIHKLFRADEFISLLFGRLIFAFS